MSDRDEQEPAPSVSSSNSAPQQEQQTELQEQQQPQTHGVSQTDPLQQQQQQAQGSAAPLALTGQHYQQAAPIVPMVDPYAQPPLAQVWTGEYLHGPPLFLHPFTPHRMSWMPTVHPPAPTRPANWVPPHPAYGDIRARSVLNQHRAQANAIHVEEARQRNAPRLRAYAEAYPDEAAAAEEAGVELTIPENHPDFPEPPPDDKPPAPAKWREYWNLDQFNRYPAYAQHDPECLNPMPFMGARRQGLHAREDELYRSMHQTYTENRTSNNRQNRGPYQASGEDQSFRLTPIEGGPIAQQRILPGYGQQPPSTGLYPLEPMELEHREQRRGLPTIIEDWDLEEEVTIQTGAQPSSAMQNLQQPTLDDSDMPDATMDDTDMPDATMDDMDLYWTPAEEDRAMERGEPSQKRQRRE